MEGRLCICVFWREVVTRVTRGSRGVEELNDPAAVVPLQILDPRSNGPASWREVLCIGGCVEQGGEVKGVDGSAADNSGLLQHTWPLNEKGAWHCEGISMALAPHLLKTNVPLNISVLCLNTKQSEVINHPFCVAEHLLQKIKSRTQHS